MQREYLQNGMSCTEEPVLMERYLNDQINSTKVRPQDTILGVTQAQLDDVGIFLIKF